MDGADRATMDGSSVSGADNVHFRRGSWVFERRCRITRMQRDYAPPFVIAR
jgi:hypothetical protein